MALVSVCSCFLACRISLNCFVSVGCSLIMEFAVNKCVICHCDNDSSITCLTDKDISTLLAAHEARGDLELHQYLLSVPDTVCVHTNCRKYYDLRKLKRRRIENTSPATSRTSHSDASTFKWKTICFLCCEEVDVDNVDVHCARTLLLRDNLLRNCAERGDSWAVHVKGCLDSSNDSVAEEAMYHRSCYIRFKQGRDITVDNTPVSYTHLTLPTILRV